MQPSREQNNYALKLNQVTHAAWNSPNANPGTQSQIGSGPFASATAITSNPSATTTLTQTNGTHSQNPSQNPSSNLQQHNQPQSLNHTHLNPPPGVPPPTSSFVQQPSQHAPGAIANAATANNNTNNNANPGSTPAVGTRYMANGMAVPTPQEPHNHPQTPAQQVLMSAADRWGLLGLLAMIKNAGSEVDGGLSSVGTDLGTMGLDVGYHG